MAKNKIDFKHPTFHSICVQSFKDSDNINLSDVPTKCSLTRKIQTWRKLRKHELTFEEGVAFLKAAPHWPLRPETIPMLEQKIHAKTSKKLIREWFTQHTPVTAKGMEAFLDSLESNERNRPQLITIFKTFWLCDYITPIEQTNLLKKYGYLLNAYDHQQRVEMLLWKHKIQTASLLLPRLDPSKRATYQTWINLLNKKGHLITSTHPGIATELAIQALNEDNELLAAKILLNIDINRVFSLSNVYSTTLIRTIRKLILNRQYNVAFQLTQKGLRFAVYNPSTVDLHWLCGWILTTYLNNPTKAIDHFNSAASLTKVSADRAQYVFWVGKAAEKAGQRQKAQHAYEQASHFPHTFYGQLAMRILNKTVALKSYVPNINETQQFLSKDLVQAIQLLHDAEQHTIKNILLDTLHEHLKTIGEYTIGFYFTQQYSTPYYTIHYYEKVNKLTNLITPDVFLRIDFQPEQFPNLHFIHAMTFNESRFHPMIKSDMGALGLMQITPLTGRHLAAKGHPYEETRLYKDPLYNLKMGEFYLNELFCRFNNSYLLLATAYNAGPTYLSTWIKRYGAPKHDYDYEWIERLPYKETRDYVKKLLSMMLLYKNYSHTMPIYTPQQLMEAYLNGCL
jgi:soluble lytic murein transglycosylase